MTDPVTDVYALLKVMANPDHHKQRLDDLVAHQKAVDEKIAAHNELIAKTKGMHSAAEASMIVANNRKATLDQREAELKRQFSELETSVAEHNKLKQQFTAQIKQREAAAALKETSVLERENALGEREQTVKRESARLAALKIEYEAKIKKLKELAV